MNLMNGLSMKRSILNAMRKYVTAANTIFALSSGLGKCGVAVIRVSGTEAGTALKTLTKMKELAEPRRAVLRKLYHPDTEDILDRGLILWFPGPRSFTGEDCCEFHVHGSTAVVSAVLNALGSMNNLRPAEPGEFTRRAFYSKKMDLIEVEGLSTLLQAETEIQRKHALLQTEGVLSNVYKRWRKTLLKKLANIDACIDFEETEILDDKLLSDVYKDVNSLNEEIKFFLVNGHKGIILQNGVRTTIIGEPNVGKSSIFNILCLKSAAIVSPIEGTTRDLLEASIDIKGYPLILTDTAGLRKSASDVVEREGIKRAYKSALDSDFIIFVIDITKYMKWKTKFPTGLFSSYIQHSLDLMGYANMDLYKRQYLIIVNKIDLVDNDAIIKDICATDESIGTISCTTKTGISDCLEKIHQRLINICGLPSKDHPSVINERQQYLLALCSKHLELCKPTEINSDVVILAQHLRSAVRELDKITGNVTTDALLDIIFKEFCIGK